MAKSLFGALEKQKVKKKSAGKDKKNSPKKPPTNLMKAIGAC